MSQRPAFTYDEMSDAESHRFDDFLDELGQRCSLAQNLKLWVRSTDRLEVHQFGALNGPTFANWLIRGLDAQGIDFTRRIGTVVLRQGWVANNVVKAIKRSEFEHFFFNVPPKLSNGPLNVVPEKFLQPINMWPAQDFQAMKQLLRNLEATGFPSAFKLALATSAQDPHYYINTHCMAGPMEAYFQNWFIQYYGQTTTVFSRAVGSVLLQNPASLRSAIDMIMATPYRCLFFGEDTPAPAAARPVEAQSLLINLDKILEPVGISRSDYLDIMFDLNTGPTKICTILPVQSPERDRALKILRDGRWWTAEKASDFLLQFQACAVSAGQFISISCTIPRFRELLGLSPPANPQYPGQEPGWSPIQTSDVIKAWDSKTEQDELLKGSPTGMQLLFDSMIDIRRQPQHILAANLDSALTDPDVLKYIKERLSWMLPGESTLKDVLANMDGHWAYLIRSLVAEAEEKLGKPKNLVKFGTLDHAVHHIVTAVPAQDILFYDPRRSAEERETAFAELVSSAFLADQFCELAGQPVRANLTDAQQHAYFTELKARLSERTQVRRRVVREIKEKQALRLKNANPAEPPFDIQLAQLDTLVADFTASRGPVASPQKLNLRGKATSGVWSIKEMFERLAINNDKFLAGMEEWEECYAANQDCYRDVSLEQFAVYLMQSFGATPGQASKVKKEFTDMGRIGAKKQ